MRADLQEKDRLTRADLQGKDRMIQRQTELFMKQQHELFAQTLGLVRSNPSQQSELPVHQSNGQAMAKTQPRKQYESWTNEQLSNWLVSRCIPDDKIRRTGFTGEVFFRLLREDDFAKAFGFSREQVTFLSYLKEGLE